MTFCGRLSAGLVVGFFFHHPRIFRAFIARERADHQIDGAANQFGREIGMTKRGNLFDEFVDDLKTDFGMGHFPAAKFQRDFDLHVLAEKINGMRDFDPQIMRINPRA